MVRSIFSSFFALVNIFRREVTILFFILFLFGLTSCRLNDNEIKGTIGCHADCSSSPGNGGGSGNPADPIVGLTAGKLVFVVEPTNAAVNSTMSEVQVDVRSGSNVRVLTNQVVVSLSIHSDTSYGLARLGGTLSATTVNGVARFPNLMINKSFDNFQLGASASGLKPAVSEPFNVVGSATQIYRSVGPGKNSYLADGALNQMTISNSVATFTHPLPDNVGLGDAIQYDSSAGGNGSGLGSVDRIVFVHRRISSTKYLVKQADGSGADATFGDRDWSVCRAYTDLWSAIGDSGGGSENDLIDLLVRDFDFFSNSGGDDLTVANRIWNVVLYGDGVQGNPIYVWNWTTDSLRYLRLFTPVWPTEVGVSQRHFGQWTEKAFRMGVPTVGGDGNRLSVKTNTVTVDGLQIMVDDDGGSVSGLYIESTGSSVVSNNILRKIDSVSWGSGIYIGSTGGIGKIFDNLIYGFDVFNSIRVNAASTTQYIYNNSGFDHTSGIRSENGTVIAKNNLMKGSSNNQNYDGGFGLGSNYNISDDATVPGGGNDLASSPINFLNELFYDFRLSLTGNLAVNGGTSLVADSALPLISDIRGYPRGIGGAWDIGAFEMAESIFGDDLAAEFSQGQLSSSLEVDGSGSLRLRAISASERELQVPDASFNMSGLVALWHFNESSGQIMDASGNLHHSTASGGTPSYGQSGVLNSAMTFESASSEFIDFGQLPEIEQVSRVSLVAWVKRSSSGSKLLIGGHEPSGAYDSIFLELWDDGTLNAIVTNSSYYYGGSRALNDTQWHHIAMVFDGTLTGDANRLKAFIDGVQVPLVFSGGGSLPSLTPDLSTNFMIGTNGEGGFSDGSIDEISVWSRALGAVEMRTLYERQRGSYNSEGAEFLSRIFDSGALDGRWGRLN
ncbi:MAG: LamG domain-containing protein [Bdellovibrionales bacterium]|nr:LamG domain-containing protein [Bdellovibrionales bacterium]